MSHTGVIMSAEGRVCWRGVIANSQPSCLCGSRSPNFNITFPITDISTIAPPTVVIESNSLPPTLTSTQTEPMVVRSSASMITTNVTTGVTKFPLQSPRPKRLTANSASLRMLIATGVSLVLLLIFLVCLVVFFKKRKKKRNDQGARQQDEECNQDDLQENDGNQQIRLSHLGELSLISDDPSNTANPEGSIPDPVEHSAPVVKMVKAKIVGNGNSRSINRQDSTAPLVEHEVRIARDKRKENKMRRLENEQSGSPPRTAGDKGDSELSDTRLSPVKETTKSDHLPSPHFPAIDIINLDKTSSPSQRRDFTRLNSSTPLFDNESIESTDV